jgi:hypothetical protein
LLTGTEREYDSLGIWNTLALLARGAALGLPYVYLDYAAMEIMS